MTAAGKILAGMGSVEVTTDVGILGRERTIIVSGDELRSMGHSRICIVYHKLCAAGYAVRFRGVPRQRTGLVEEVMKAWTEMRIIDL